MVVSDDAFGEDMRVCHVPINRFRISSRIITNKRLVGREVWGRGERERETAISHCYVLVLALIKFSFYPHFKVVAAEK